MGIYRSDHVMVGWKLKLSLLEHENFNIHEFYEKCPDQFIYDGMCREYIVFGKLVLYSGDQLVGFRFAELKSEDLTLSDEETKELEDLFNECTYGLDLDDWVETEEPKAFIISHFA